MTVKEYLLTTTDINLAELARKMWPTNKNAKSYLSRKLSGDRPFTDKDAVLARKVLIELGHKLLSLE